MKHDGLKFKDCAKVLKRNGFALVSQNGSHCKFVRDNRSMVICNSHAKINKIMIDFTGKILYNIIVQVYENLNFIKCIGVIG